jgi:isochorismate pyruvate lyase
MGEVREQIDRIDRALVKLIAERMTYIERAGTIKKTRDEWRIQDVLNKVLAESKRAGLPARIAEPVWRTMIESCIAHEFDVFDARESQPAR